MEEKVQVDRLRGDKEFNERRRTIVPSSENSRRTTLLINKARPSIEPTGQDI